MLEYRNREACETRLVMVLKQMGVVDPALNMMPGVREREGGKEDREGPRRGRARGSYQLPIWRGTRISLDMQGRRTWGLWHQSCTYIQVHGLTTEIDVAELLVVAMKLTFI